MQNQFIILGIFIFSGVLIGILFDFFRITRRILKLPNFIIYLEDIIFWILTGVILIFTIYNVNGGFIRLYHILSILFGCLVYFVSFSRIIFKFINLLKNNKKM